jgi:hypothetical protein
MLEGKVPALALRKPVGKFVGGRLSTVESVAVSAEPGGGESPELIVRRGGGLYRAAFSLSSPCSSLSLTLIRKISSDYNC